MEPEKLNTPSFRLQSWGRYPRLSAIVRDVPREGNASFQDGASFLAYGRGRSYGDCCLNPGGVLLATHALDHFISFDHETGLLVAEAGVGFEEILSAVVPRGWFLPVTPGTQFVTLGGAVANDIHGKNHHRSGTIGRFVEWFDLLRSDGRVIRCSQSENQELFSATIGGMGLTGIMLRIGLRMSRIETPYINMDSTQFGSLDEFFSISADADIRYEYTVAWLDCVSSGSGFGRGVFMGGNSLPLDQLTRRMRTCERDRVSSPMIGVPFNLPSWVLNRYSVKAFNELYYRKQIKKHVSKAVHYRPFFYPLDAVNNWNRIYGRNGFLQFQCVVPKAIQRTVIPEMLRTIVASGQASFLAVLKEFGALSSPGLMSFPQEGATLALDFAHRGSSTLELIARLERLTDEAGGRMYSAKDATMAGDLYRKHYPQWERFSKSIDPRFGSGFWNRMMR